MAKAAYEHWYWKRRWRRRSAWQLREHPLCCRCLTLGKVVAAEVADHRIPHRGDEQVFWFGELQSLCVQCHNSAKQATEIRGFDNAIGIDGKPLDPKHPWYTGRLPEQSQPLPSGGGGARRAPSSRS
jgi:5-methylcytosine-specific restriction enzyme A